MCKEDPEEVNLIGWPPRNCPICGFETGDEHIEIKRMKYSNRTDGYVATQIGLFCPKCKILIQKDEKRR